eukprot:TRINITY_DN318_c0_g3_i4.p1 TRINITY_DN318_c0_g3~~TRINITY_DN318_c0_g3_i4.p1  ORF type:complete len:216 (+),score=55.33 TRINITY_DN318_c0_g3_i4:177-824(+)
MSTRAVLTFKDTSLYHSDILLLKQPNWLNDNLINFYFDYLQEKYKELKCLFIGPSITQMFSIGLSDSDLREILQPHNFYQQDIVLLPVNDSLSTDQVSGSHWSLLVFFKKENIFRHYDSLMNVNKNAALRIANRFSSILSISTSILEFQGIRQQNSYDCGIYLLSFADLVATIYKQSLITGHFNQNILIETLTPSYITNKRDEINQLILDLAANK